MYFNSTQKSLSTEEHIPLYQFTVLACHCIVPVIQLIEHQIREWHWTDRICASNLSHCVTQSAFGNYKALSLSSDKAYLPLAKKVGYWSDKETWTNLCRPIHFSDWGMYWCARQKAWWYAKSCPGCFCCGLFVRLVTQMSTSARVAFKWLHIPLTSGQLAAIHHTTGW